MEQAEQICDQICIIARGEKVLEGDLADIKRAAADEGKIAIGFRDDEARMAAARVLDHEPAELEIEIHVPDGGALLAKLVGAGVALRRFEMVQPSLHEIFVAKVGEAAKVAARKEAS
jgi:ABC-2 type transport system ATP-binding protein